MTPRTELDTSRFISNLFGCNCFFSICRGRAAIGSSETCLEDDFFFFCFSLVSSVISESDSCVWVFFFGGEGIKYGVRNEEVLAASVSLT